VTGAVRSALRSVGSLLIGSGLQVAANAIAAILATLWLPPAERGIMVLGTTVASIVSLLAGLGVGNAYRGRHPRLSSEDARAFSREFTAALALCVVLGGVSGAVASWVLSLVTESALGTAPIIAAVALASSVQVAQLLLTEARFALGEFVAGSRWSALGSVAGLGSLCIAAAMGTGPAGYIFAQSLGSGIVVLLGARGAFIAGALRWGRSSPGGVAALTLRGVKSMGLPLGIVLISRADRIILASATSAKVIAVYALAATISEVLRLVPTAVGQLTTRHVATGQGWSIVRRHQLISLLVCAVTGSLIFVAAALLIPEVFGAQYSQATQFLAILLVGEVFYSILVISNRGLIGGEWSNIATLLGGWAVFAALPLYFAGSFLWGAVGCAVARVAVFVVISLFASRALRRRMEGPS